jgi:hypothetical protein
MQNLAFPLIYRKKTQSNTIAAFSRASGFSTIGRFLSLQSNIPTIAAPG